MDFYTIKERSAKNGVTEVYVDFKVCRSRDLMVRGKSFYAVWDSERKIWSTDEYDVQRLIDIELMEYYTELKARTEGVVKVKLLGVYSSRAWAEFKSYLQNLADNYHQLDETITFSNDDVKKTDYVSKRLPYPLEEGPIDAYNEIMDTIYLPEERDKLEWSIGAIISGDAKTIQKFLVLYGDAGTGKSTFLNIIQKLFKGYYTTFEAKALTSSSNSFSTEVFKTNPLVAIQHDGDLSRIEDNSKLNSIVSHEEMVMNEKFKSSYTSKINSFLYMGTNKAVKITDSKSGIIRRLIDVKPSGNKLPVKRYQALYQQIDFELGGIAYYCLQKYREMGKNYYADYVPLDMILQTDVFFNFVESQFENFVEADGVTLTQAYDMYKKYCEESFVDYKLARHRFRDELKSYFENFSDVARVDGKQIRSYYSGFKYEKFKPVDKKKKKKVEHQYSLVLDSDISLLDSLYSNAPAQLASVYETPRVEWDSVTTTLSDIDTTQLHFLRIPENHIVIDFDLKDSEGNKSMELNLAEASKFPPTYSEFSKSGGGIHLHYFYDGDVNRLDRIYSEGVEIKVFTGKQSLRRKLTKCNTTSITTINSGLPLRGEKMISENNVRSEKGLRALITKSINKEVHASTKPNIDFIHKILEDAYNKPDFYYDVTNMRPAILAFANGSSNQAAYCLKVVNDMKFKSKESTYDVVVPEQPSSDEIAFFDIEVYPNLFLVCWKFKGEDKKMVRMFNPTPKEIGELLTLKLVGFNNRRYDNHILYARYIGYNNEQLFELSQKIINNSKNAMFMEAYNLSHTDIYDYSTKKQSLKKWELDLGIKHNEMDIPWDQPVDESKWETIAEYCEDDVYATEATFNATKADYSARLILSLLSNLTPNHTTQQHTARIIFGEDKKPQDKFVYTDLSEMFPGYVFANGKSTYRGHEVSEGGQVEAEPGMYFNVPVLDVVSMHPHSLIALNYFGPYTKNFKDIVDGRVLIKNYKREEAAKIFDGKLIPFLGDNDSMDDLAYALKIAINIVYGMTSASFPNIFKHPDNIDNIVAKRGALFMIDLMLAVKEKGFTVAHIKTDSIKIPNATPEIIEFVKEFGRRYQYEFEHEETYEKFCLVNNAVYIAKVGWSPKPKKIGKWTATGAQFAHPYIFKTLFSKEEILHEDLVETKAVKTAMYLDRNEGLDIDEKLVIEYENRRANRDLIRQEAPPRHKLNPAYEKYTDVEIEELVEKQRNLVFVGKVGAFYPIKPGHGGGILYRENKIPSFVLGKMASVTGTKGYRWLTKEHVDSFKLHDAIDMRYYHELANDAINTINKFGDFEMFKD